MSTEIQENKGIIDFTISVKVELRPQDIADVVCNGIECGFGWFAWPKNAKGRYITDVLLEDGYLDMMGIDPENDDLRIMKRLNLFDFARGFALYFERYSIGSWDQYEGIMDAGTDDMILQYAFYGEVIFG